MRPVLSATPAAFLALLAMWPGVCAPAHAAAPTKKAIIFVIDQITWQDIAEAPTPTIDSLVERGGIASMSCWTAPPVSRERAYVSIGAGSRARAPAGRPERSYNVPPGAGPVPERPLPPYALPGQIVNPWAGELQRDNARLRHRVEVGALGEALHAAGLRTAVLGNADRGEVQLRPGRAAVTIAMDGRGIVDSGDVGFGLLRADPDGAVPVQTDVLALVGRLAECLPTSDLIVIESGDTVRAAFSARDPLQPESYERDRKLTALERADYCLGQILPRLDSQWLLVVLSPAPSLTRFRWMTPAIVSGPNWSAGYVTSGTTRRPGIIAAMDIAPTVLSYFGLPSPASLAGRPAWPAEVRGVPPEASARVARLVDAETRTYHTVRARHVFVPAHVFGAVCAALLAILCPGRLAPTALRWGRAPIATFQLLIFAMPITGTLALLAPVGLTGVQIVGVVMAGAVMLSAASAFLRWEDLAPIRLLCWLQVFVLIVDVWGCDARLQLASLYGASPVTGARFYGLGNQGIALLLGASIVAFATTAGLRGGKRPSRLVLPALCGLLLTLTAGHPRLGANTGGAITAVVLYGTWLLMLANPRKRSLAIGLIAAAVVAVLGAFILMDLLARGEPETHMARAARHVFSGGPAAIWQIASRKLAAGVSILLYTPWSVVLVAWFAFLVYAAFRPPAALRSAWEAHPPLRMAAATLAVGGIIGSLVNDTSICVGALMLSYPILTMAFTAITRRSGSPNS
jgi:hypothetical protein